MYLGHLNKRTSKFFRATLSCTRSYIPRDGLFPFRYAIASALRPSKDSLQVTLTSQASWSYTLLRQNGGFRIRFNFQKRSSRVLDTQKGGHVVEIWFFPHQQTDSVPTSFTGPRQLMPRGFDVTIGAAGPKAVSKKLRTNITPTRYG